MERGNTKHGRLLDEEMQHETEGMMRSGQIAHAEEFLETEAILPDDDEGLDNGEDVGGVG